MPAVQNDQIALLHVPKTGGTWATQAIIEAGVDVHEPDVSDPDSQYAAKGHVTIDEIAERDELFVIGFVRHPLDWWRSFWVHRMRHGWNSPDHEVDSRASSEDFDDFVEQVIANLPGFLGEFYARFVGPPEHPISFIGRYETLVDDLCEALQLAGQPFDEEKLRSFPARNVGDYASHPAPYRPDLAKRLAYVERDAIRRFYSAPRLAVRLRGRAALTTYRAAALGSVRAETGTPPILPRGTGPTRASAGRPWEGVKPGTMEER
jgi:hypothetical protein